MREFFKSKTKIIITAAALAFVLLAGSLAYIFKGFSLSGSGAASDQAGESFVYDGDGNLLESGKTYPLTASLIFSGAAPMAEASGVTVKAVILPENATNKKVDWSVSWLDPLSAWAAGKAAAEYLKITPSSDGSLTASATCLKAFGEKIRITVTSRDDITVKASCTADYVQRATGLRGEFTGSGLGDKSFTFSDTEIPTINFLLNHNYMLYLYDFLLDSGYTEAELNSGDWSWFDYTNFIYSDLGKVAQGCNVKCPKFTVTSPAYTLADSFDVDVFVYTSDGYREYCEGLGYTGNLGAGVNMKTWFIPEEYTAYWLFGIGAGIDDFGQLRTLMTGCKNLGIPQLEIRVTVTGTYSSFTKSYPAWVDIDSLKYPVKSLRLETGNAAF